jgi:hypothetical protein
MSVYRVEVGERTVAKLRAILSVCGPKSLLTNGETCFVVQCTPLAADSLMETYDWVESVTPHMPSMVKSVLH